MSKVKEIDDKEFDDLVAEQRFTETQQVLKEIVHAVSTKKNEDIKAALDKQTNAIVEQLALLNQLPKEPDNDEDRVVLAISIMTDNILKGLAAVSEEVRISNEPKEWKFEFKRTEYSHLIESVTAKQIK